MFIKGWDMVLQNDVSLYDEYMLKERSCQTIPTPQVIIAHIKT